MSNHHSPRLRPRRADLERELKDLDYVFRAIRRTADGGFKIPESPTREGGAYPISEDENHAQSHRTG